MRVAELVIEDKVDDEEVYAVEPESWEERELWLMVWLKPGMPPVVLLMLPPALLVENTGAVFVLARGPWTWAIRVATPTDDMYWVGENMVRHSNPDVDGEETAMERGWGEEGFLLPVSWVAGGCLRVVAPERLNAA
jgi:hypothetical protein